MIQWYLFAFIKLKYEDMGHWLPHSPKMVNGVKIKRGNIIYVIKRINSSLSGFESNLSRSRTAKEEIASML
jgi:chemotaxis signal transduction protein